MSQTPVELAEEFEQRMLDDMADVALVIQLIVTTTAWDDFRKQGLFERDGRLRIRAAGEWLGGHTLMEWESRIVNPESPAFELLWRNWVVTTFEMWEKEYRPRIAGGLHTSVNVDVLGDLRHLRDDIVHHGAFASKEHASKCGSSQMRV